MDDEFVRVIEIAKAVDWANTKLQVLGLDHKYGIIYAPHDIGNGWANRKDCAILIGLFGNEVLVEVNDDPKKACTILLMRVQLINGNQLIRKNPNLDLVKSSY